jgi:hypothetical protein
MIWQLFPVFDWLVIIIGLGSLLLVLPPICNLSFSFMGTWVSGPRYLALRTWVSGPRKLSILRSSYLFPITFLCVHRHFSLRPQ